MPKDRKECACKVRVLVNSGVMYDMLREVRTVFENARSFMLSLEPCKAGKVSDGWLPDNTT